MSRNYLLRNADRGFTIIELMLAMTFVAFILIFMSLTIVQMLRTYDKALSMKQINQAGRSVTEDISRTMRSQLPTSIKLSAVGDGVMCIDKTMYYWTPVFRNGTTLANAAINNSANAVTGPVATGGTMVRKTLKNANSTCNATSAGNASLFEPGSEEVLLTSRSRVMWASATPNSDGRLINLQFIIGTYDRNELDTGAERAQMANATGPFTNFYLTPHRESGNPTCLPGNDGNYCAYAEFDTTVYVSQEPQQ